MSDLIKEKAHGLVKLFPRVEAVRLIVRLMDNNGKRTESVVVDITGAGIMGDELIVQTFNGKARLKRFLLKNIFDLVAPNEFLQQLN